MKRLSIVSAAIEAGAGSALLVFPSMTATLLVGAPLESPASLVVARICGAGLLALGVACWFARTDSQSPATRSLISAMALYNVLTTAVLAYAGVFFDLHAVLLWPAVLLHTGMAVWCVFVLSANLRANP